MSFGPAKAGTAISLALGLAILGWGIRLRVSEASARTWHVTRGEVMSFSWGHSDGVNYPRVTYRYTVDGVAYQGNRILFGSRGLATLRERAVGDSVRVFYDPREPREAVLEPWVSTNWEFFVIFGLLFATTMAFQLRWLARRSRGGAD
ncbi:MAG: DUF3592 domain-containing protein [Thermoanaerobaculia bacterium]